MKPEDHLQNQISNLREDHHTVWKGFTAWYTTILTINLIAIGYLGAGSGLRNSMLILMFAIFNLISIIWSAVIARYSKRTAASIQKTRKALWEHTGIRRESKLYQSLYEDVEPNYVTSWASIGMITTFSLFCIVWILLLFKVDFLDFK